MSQATPIEWTDFSWNFLRGCSRVSEGCARCYAERQAIRHAGPGGPYEGLVKSTAKGPRWTGEVSFHEDILLQPLKRKKPTKYFVNSMSDLFHEKVKDAWLDKAFAVMALTPQHTYQILTKRPERMLEYLTANTQVSNALAFQTANARIMMRVFSTLSAAKSPLNQWQRLIKDGLFIEMEPEVFWFAKWPLPNVWLGVSCEDQKTADERIPILLDTPAAVRWVSAEPLLGPVDLTHYLHTRYLHGGPYHETERLDWAVVGGESGPGTRPCDISWIRSIVNQCEAAGTAVFVKQLGSKPRYQRQELGSSVENVTRKLQNKKGGDISEFPIDLRIREFPNVKAEVTA